MFQGITEQIKELEKAKNYYIKKNKEQAKTVQSFISQIAGNCFSLRVVGKQPVVCVAKHTTWKYKYFAFIAIQSIRAF